MCDSKKLSALAVAACFTSFAPVAFGLETACSGDAEACHHADDQSLLHLARFNRETPRKDAAKFNGAFCGVATATDEFMSDTAASDMLASGIDWFWNWAAKTTYKPSGFKFLPMQWGYSVNGLPSGTDFPPGLKMDDYYDYQSYGRYWDSLGTTYGPYQKAEADANLMQGWNEPDMPGMCMVNKGPNAPDKDGNLCSHNPGETWPITWCNFDDSDHDKACPNDLGGSAATYDPQSWQWNRYWCCCEASGTGWWAPDLIWVWKNETKGQYAGKPNRFAGQVLASWDAYAYQARQGGYLLGSPAVANEVGTWLKWLVSNRCPGEYCPDYLIFHNYDTGCVDTPGPGLEQKIQDAVALIKAYPTIKGMLITELGLLTGSSGSAGGACDKTPTYLANLFTLFKKYREYIAGISWFSENGSGGTYDISLFDSGSHDLNELGQTYAQQCKTMM